MTDYTPYIKLGVSEDASFEEIKDARDRLLEELEGDKPAQELVEAAYDAILMDRLRARQEGKIKVPDRIRFPEKTINTSPTTFLPNNRQARLNWLTNLRDNPSRRDLITYTGTFVIIFILGIMLPNSFSIWMAVALLASIYFLRQKENRFWRSILLSLSALVIGVALSTGLLPLVAPVLVGSPASVAIILGVIWLVTAFLR